MFRSQALFIVGAGASHEAGLPLGDGLKVEIANALNFRRMSGDAPSSAASVYRAIVQHLQQIGTPGEINHYRGCAERIRRNVESASSIDHYLDNHRGDSAIETCGKLAVAQIILNAERASTIYYESSDPKNSIDLERVRQKWFESFFRRLTEEVSAQEVESIFDNVGFIIFNYDRCVEHFLYDALRQRYHLEQKRAAEIMSGLRIARPYGSVGELPWQSASSGFEFGGNPTPQQLPGIASGLKTFTEGQDDPALKKNISDMLRRADRIVFLGFGYHRQNIDALRVTGDCKVRTVIGTAREISHTNLRQIEKALRAHWKREAEFCEFHLNTLVECGKLFDEYSWDLTADAP